MNEHLRSLHDLATAAADRHPGDSDRALARKASDAGYTVAYTTISKIRGGTYRSRPSHKTLDALAWLAGVSRETAYAAAGEYLSPNPFADELPPEADRLTPKQRAAIIGVIRTMLDPGMPAAGADEVPGATKQVGQHYPASAPADGLPSTASDQVLIVRQNKHIPSWTDVTTPEDDAEVVQQQREVDDDLYSQWLSGQGGFDEVTERRYRARADAEGAQREVTPDDTAVAARTGESRDIEEHDRSLLRGEESQDPGGDDLR